MLKRVLLTTLICLLAAGLFGGYFFHVGRLVKARRSEAVCRGIEVVVKDSLENSLLSAAEILERISPWIPESRTDSVDLYAIELMVSGMGEVADAQAFRKDNEHVVVELTQRRPVVRFLGQDGSFYADNDGYIFPVRSNFDVPVITGNIPFKPGADFKGYLNETDQQWISGAISMAQTIASSDYWSRQIGQIDVDRNGDFVLYPVASNHTVVIGDSGMIGFKLRKLEAFYRNILPTEKGSQYSVVNLKYGNQIICK